MAEKRTACVCCGYFTMIGEPDDYAWDICPVCFWECDVFSDNPDKSSGANHMTIRQGRENFQKYGACDEKFVKNVRPPKKEELPENNI